MRIGILGLGGIGGFIGAKLVENYKDNPEIKIVFISRGATKTAILNNGLSLNSGGETVNIKPNLVSDNSTEIRVLDILIITTKAYSLTNVIEQYKDCISDETVIIPLQNGVNSKDVIVENSDIEATNILEGCIYIASNISEPGVVNHVGGPGKIVFGNSDDKDFYWVQELLEKGGLTIKYTKSIKEVLWKKFLFVSPLATMTTALNVTFGEVLDSDELMATLKSLMIEVQQLANKFEVTITNENIEESLAMLSNFPSNSKSSLQLDFEQKNEKNEKSIFVDYVINNANKYGISVEYYKTMNTKISANN
ncbi:2-dehydropantoate 2-reductase [Cellulophaga baltica]|uniref:ketopantoate reductase family protein n=1 Tax=Cellulophaga TaxID=104264 RepID=UPI001C0662BF|nr:MULTISPECIES: 2-dehydropantoate 2-reductase [Cellulophaga]MBU2997147.1 2-dehydropantoate 2-reductase [Cellulophaga baltica]MDO6768545.1 2-dehydropantoate 2-reductase [Cellulophaga sp. 1_MG-2023]